MTPDDNGCPEIYKPKQESATEAATAATQKEDDDDDEPFTTEDIKEAMEHVHRTVAKFTSNFPRTPQHERNYALVLSVGYRRNKKKKLYPFKATAEQRTLDLAILDCKERMHFRRHCGSVELLKFNFETMVPLGEPFEIACDEKGQAELVDALDKARYVVVADLKSERLAIEALLLSNTDKPVDKDEAIYRRNYCTMMTTPFFDLTKLLQEHKQAIEPLQPKQRPQFALVRDMHNAFANLFAYFSAVRYRVLIRANSAFLANSKDAHLLATAV